jgi:hypothetical protein
MKKSKLRIIPLVLMGSALIGCNATTLARDHDDVVTKTVVTKTIVNQNHDGEYEVYGTCSWPDYNDGAAVSINDEYNVWTIKKGVLNYKSGQFNITGKVKGDTLSISGKRKSGISNGWYGLDFSGKLTSPTDSVLHGSWKTGDCKFTLRKVIELVNVVDTPYRQMEIKVASSNPFNMPALLFGGGIPREVPVKVNAPHHGYAGNKPFVIIIPSSTPDMRSEEYIAKELRKNGYNTAVVYSYKSVDSGEKFSSKLTSSALLADLVETARQLKYNYGYGANGFMGIGTSRGALAIMKAGFEDFRDMYHGADLITHGVALNGPCYERLDALKVRSDFSLLIANGEDDDSTPVAPCKKMVSMLDDNVKLYVHPNGWHHFFTPDYVQKKYYDKNGMHFMNKCSLGLTNDMRATVQERGTDKITILTPENYKRTIGPCIGRGAHYGGDRNGFDALLKQIELLSN